MRWACIVAVVSLLPGSADAQARTRTRTRTRIGVGLFAPDVPFAGPGPRYAFARALAEHVGKAIGQPVEARAYKSAADFERDVGSRKIHYALVSGIYQASFPARRLLATARLATPADAMWSLLAVKRIPLAELTGKTIQVARLGPRTLAFVDNALLAGMRSLASAAKIVRAPDIKSSVTAVALGRADVVFGPASTRGLVPIVGPVRVAPPAFVVVDRRARPDVIARVGAAVRTFSRPRGTLRGFGPPAPARYRSVAARSRPRTYRMSLLVAKPPRLRPSEVVDTARLAAQLPPLEALFWAP